MTDRERPAVWEILFLGADAAVVASFVSLALLALGTTVLADTNSRFLGWMLVATGPVVGVCAAWLLHGRRSSVPIVAGLVVSCLLAGALGTFGLFALLGALSTLGSGAVANAPYYLAWALPALLAIAASVREYRGEQAPAAGLRTVRAYVRGISVVGFGAVALLWLVPYIRSVGDPLAFIGFVIPVLAGYVVGIGAATAVAVGRTLPWRPKRGSGQY